MPKETFKEAFLHYIWQFQYFNKTGLKTTEGEDIQILSLGFPNSNSGPDFQQSRLNINSIEWYGHVEIHYKSSDWISHSHSRDPAYNNVILHVVWEADASPQRADGTTLPTLTLSGRVEKELIAKYEALLKNPISLPCSSHLPHVERIYISSMKDRCLVERLEEKSTEILKIFSSTKNNWEETAYQWLGKCFGFKVNSEPFQKLCEILPYDLLKKYKNNSLQTEALLFGVSGLLDKEFASDYPLQLKKEFEYLKHKHIIGKSLNLSEWKFLRLRPHNFPTLRLAQFAAFLIVCKDLFDFVFKTPHSSSHFSLFAAPSHPFWNNHYVWEKKASQAKNEVQMGTSSIENLLMNGIFPLRFAHAHFLGNEDLKNDIAESFRQLKAEKNHILTYFDEFENMEIKTAYDSQSLLQLYKRYCDKKKCLSCHIGHQILFST